MKCQVEPEPVLQDWKVIALFEDDKKLKPSYVTQTNIDFWKAVDLLVIRERKRKKLSSIERNAKTQEKARLKDKNDDKCLLKIFESLVQVYHL